MKGQGREQLSLPPDEDIGPLGTRLLGACPHLCQTRALGRAPLGRVVGLSQLSLLLSQTNKPFLGARVPSRQTAVPAPGGQRHPRGAGRDAGRGSESGWGLGWGMFSGFEHVLS